jgi:intracellular sulfur oxidation DsrE/DsrF family protein
MRFVILLIAFFTLLYSKEYKVVFDCSTSDVSYLKSRMWLIGKTIDTIEADSNRVKVLLTMHGKCSIVASKEFDMYVEDSEVEAMSKAQKHLKKLLKRPNFKAVVCAMSLSSNGIEQSSVISGVKISKNSFLDTIEAQNNGYAIMTFK